MTGCLSFATQSWRKLAQSFAEVKGFVVGVQASACLWNASTTPILRAPPGPIFCHNPKLDSLPMSSQRPPARSVSNRRRRSKTANPAIVRRNHDALDCDERNSRSPNNAGLISLQFPHSCTRFCDPFSHHSDSRSWKFGHATGQQPKARRPNDQCGSAHGNDSAKRTMRRSRRNSV